MLRLAHNRSPINISSVPIFEMSLCSILRNVGVHCLHVLRQSENFCVWRNPPVCDFLRIQLVERCHWLAAEAFSSFLKVEAFEYSAFVSDLSSNITNPPV